jgi:hypothetical protein
MNTRFFVRLLIIVVLAFGVISCGDAGDVQKSISDQAIVENAANSAFDFFFTEVVCADPGNTMSTCQ